MPIFISTTSINTTVLHLNPSAIFRHEKEKSNTFYKHLFIFISQLTSSDKDSILFQNVCVLWNLGLNVLFCHLGQLVHCLFLGVAELGLLLSLLLQGGCDGLVLPADLVSQTPKKSELKGEKKKKPRSVCFMGQQWLTESYAQHFYTTDKNRIFNLLHQICLKLENVFRLKNTLNVLCHNSIKNTSTLSTTCLTQLSNQIRKVCLINGWSVSG